MRPYDYRMETDANGVATTEIKPTGWGEGVVYWPKLDIEVKKGPRTAHDSVKVVGAIGIHVFAPAFGIDEN